MRLSKTLLGASTVLQPMKRKEEMGLEGWQAGSWGWPYKVKSAVSSCQSSVSAAGTVGGSWNTDWESEWHNHGYTHNLSYICPCGCTEYMEVDFEVKPLNSHFLCVCPLFPVFLFPQLWCSHSPAFPLFWEVTHARGPSSEAGIPTNVSNIWLDQFEVFWLQHDTKSIP